MNRDPLHKYRFGDTVHKLIYFEIKLAVFFLFFVFFTTYTHCSVDYPNTKLLLKKKKTLIFSHFPNGGNRVATITKLKIII